MTSCDRLSDSFCGELTGDRKMFVDRLNRHFAGKLQATQIPCYYDYLEVRCRRPVSDAVMDSIERSAKTMGWIELLVYDHNNQLIKGSYNSM